MQYLSGESEEEIKRCNFCGKKMPFPLYRTNAVYCSKHCRQNAYTRRKNYKLTPYEMEHALKIKEERDAIEREEELTVTREDNLYGMIVANMQMYAELYRNREEIRDYFCKSSLKHVTVRLYEVVFTLQFLLKTKGLVVNPNAQSFQNGVYTDLVNRLDDYSDTYTDANAEQALIQTSSSLKSIATDLDTLLNDGGLAIDLEAQANFSHDMANSIYLSIQKIPRFLSYQIKFAFCDVLE